MVQRATPHSYHSQLSTDPRLATPLECKLIGARAQVVEANRANRFPLDYLGKGVKVNRLQYIVDLTHDPSY